MRAEYRFPDGLKLHNAFTDTGLAGLLKGALRNEWPANGLFIGLCSAVPSRSLTLAAIDEPTIGVNGYARIPLARDAGAWPVSGIQGNDPYLESTIMTFTPVGGPFDKAITRMFLTDELSATVGDVWGLSGALAAPITLDVATPLAQRQFNYRVYGI